MEPKAQNPVRYILTTELLVKSTSWRKILELRNIWETVMKSEWGKLNNYNNFDFRHIHHRNQCKEVRLWIWINCRYLA